VPLQLVCCKHTHQQHSLLLHPSQARRWLSLLLLVLVACLMLLHQASRCHLWQVVVCMLPPCCSQGRC
jgi:hypothetical protein